MDNINDINSYNSITMSSIVQKEKREPTNYSSTKINLINELNKTLKNLEITPFKRVSIGIHNNLQRTSFNIEKAFTNTQNTSTKDEDSSSSILTKLPKIQNQKNFNTLSGNHNLTSNNFFSNESNSTKNTKKEFAIFSDTNISNNNVGKIINNQKFKKSTKKRGSYMGSANRIYGNHPFKYKNYDSILSPPDPLLKRTAVPKINPRFGKMKEYIPLPEFKGEEPFTKFEYKPILKEMISTPSIEKQYEVSLYINSYKMLNNLIYLKTNLNKEGLVSLENLINVKKLNKYYKNEYEEEEEIIDPIQNNIDGNIIDNNGNNIKEMDQNNFQDNNPDLLINGNKKFEEENYANNKENISKDNNRFAKTGNYPHDNNKYYRPNTVYNELKPYYTLKNKNDNTLIFESRFESGNLLCAFRTSDENCYQLYLQNDTNTTGYIQWFFFRVSNTKKGRKVNFNIINMLRKTCVYNQGLKIMTYSTMAAAKENLGWHRDCYNSIYYANNLFVYNNNNASKKRNLHSLSFDYEFKYDNDTVYFANCIPYFYSTLMKELNKYELDDEKYPFFYRKTLAVTLGGNDLDMFTINSMYDILQNGIKSIITQKSKNYLYMKNSQENNSNSSQVLDERKAVVIIGRQHPGETVGSYVVKGIIDFLMGDSEEAKKLRELYVFKIVPMMNPDGVLVGNSRTSFAGCDLNRRWGKPNEIIHPEVYSTKQMILKLSNQRKIAFILDCHGHFGTFNSLFYCNYKENKRICKLFPYICSKLSKIINFQQCTFAMPRYKINTERIVLFNELEDEDNNNIVALETSFFGINRDGEYSHLYFNTKLLKEIGRDICMGMLSYYYKYDDVTIEKNFFNDTGILKQLDVDMREFEDEIIREVNEDDEEVEITDEKSESEPSVDNLDKNQIMKLMPSNGKKRKRKKTNSKFKKFDKKKENKNRDLNIELYNPIKEAEKKIEEERRKKLRNSKIFINCNIKTRKNMRKQNLITDSHVKNEYTQTEEIFFKMHWTYFSGQYKIMSCNKLGDYFNNNNFDFSSNLFGQLKKSNFYKKQIDENLKVLNRLNGINSVTRAKSFNNKIIFNNKNSIILQGVNSKININDAKKYLNNNLKKNNNINKNDNEKKNNIDNYGDINGQNKIDIINNKNNKLFNFTIDNNSNKDLLNKEPKKQSTTFAINIIKNKQNGIFRNNIKEGINMNNNYLETKYNNFNDKSYNDNIKLKMAKSSTSFYKK